jgi:hypothetical protein
VLSMAHAYGDGAPSENPDAPEQKDILFREGSNTSALISTDDDYDRFSGIPRMSALPVAIHPAPSQPSQ